MRRSKAFEFGALENGACLLGTGIEGPWRDFICRWCTIRDEGSAISRVTSGHRTAERDLV